MKKPEKQPETKTHSKETAAKQQFSLEELKAMGLDPAPYGYPADK